MKNLNLNNIEKKDYHKPDNRNSLGFTDNNYYCLQCPIKSIFCQNNCKRQG
jgi:hypothetical protein